VRALAQHFLATAIDTLGSRALSKEAADALVGYAWPGNARELRSVVLAAATGSSGVVSAEDVRRAMESISGPGAVSDISPQGARVLIEQHGSISGAARAIGVARTTLRDRLARDPSAPFGSRPRARAAR